MAFWSSADIESASRIVNSTTKDTRRVRGKLTLHFVKPQTQSDADEAADRCAMIAEAVLCEADSHEQIIGAETELASSIRLRLPPQVPQVRSLELAALHFVGDPGTSAALRRASTSSLRAVTVPQGMQGALGPNRIATPAPPPPPAAAGPANTPNSASPSGSFRVGPLSSTSPPSSAPSSSPSSTPGLSQSGSFRAGNLNAPPSTSFSGPTSAPRTGPPKRATIGRMRAISPGMMIPAGSPPDVIGQGVAPFLRDSAGRVLVGFLRAYDLLTLRGLALEGSAEMLAALVPVSDAPLGGYEASRTAELGRWQNTFGDTVFQRVRREAQVVAMFLGHRALTQAGVPQNIMMEVLQEAAPLAFSGERGMVLEMTRYVGVPEENLVTALCENIVPVVGHGDADALAAALAPLVDSVKEELTVMATIAKAGTGF